jgi:tRNA-dihydrouridine synthase C
VSPIPHPRSEGLFLAVAPMDGVTDWVHRALASELGGVSLCVTEFVRVTDAAPPERVFLRDCPELKSGGRTAGGTPVFVQLLGGDAAAMAGAARVAAGLGAPGIDINFGCPAKRVNQHDGGASILRCPARAETITRAVRDAVPPHIPVTVKVRLGWDDPSRAVEIAEAAQAGGASWLTIHARTKAQMYAPPVNYPALGRAASAISIPVVANGDITDRASLERCAAESGARAFMIGRGALADPFVFRRVRGEPVPAVDDLAALSAVLARYVELLAAAGLTPDGQLRRLKQWLGLARAVAPRLEPLFDRLKRADDLRSALRAAERAGAAAA